MREEYDFSSGMRNPYTRKLKKQVTMNINSETIEYFKALSQRTGIPYQTLMNMYLTECAHKKLEPQIAWTEA
ncbi:MAG: BrnA antitoxin family protein [Clostridia bacterium]|nr:BrnA antitoxin family protein [Clostridia bacterium]